MHPVKKISKSRTRTRRSHHALRAVNTVSCPQCGNAKLPHTACENCGYVSSKVALPQKPEES